ncbi:hypothetical protein HZF08_02910 [Paenibacillus sp. CGMCC 1.16610]|uniref:Uncharacterized protein n=1 Tax=Paenibacillus anseongense TaxID=2682845 RepID=A0ABW9UA75_9BACL|nr:MULTISPECIES: hypothetical protein [Paenibacillus]MBA2937242.1 hypothetical protein [Paenibacillus sp. CGMCC 1.16610]MVQ36301.1 hypothetical protein [Paenibacillus anseongense]
MLKQISDYLFMGSLLILLISIFVVTGSRGMTNSSNATGATTDLQMDHDHKKIMEKQDTMLSKLLKSYLFWIPIVGIIVSIILSKITL